MNAPSGRLQRLKMLIGERSAERRRALLTEIVQQFRDRSQAAMRENQELGEALLALLPKLAESERVHLATQLAPLKEAPTYLVRELAADVPAVAVPILTTSRLLVEEDLMAAARNAGDERLAALAQRPDLTPPLQALIAKSGKEHLLVLVRNPSFAPPPELLGSLIIRARSDEKLARSLARRSNMPVSALAELFFFLKTQDRVQLTHALGRSVEHLPSPPKPSPEGETALLRTARNDDRQGVLRALASHYKLSEPAERILRDATCEALAVLCLGLGISRATYSSLTILMRPDTGDGLSRMLNQIELFSADGARRIALEWLRGPLLAQTLAVSTAKPTASPRKPAPSTKPAPAQKEESVPRGKVFGRFRPNKAKPKDEEGDDPPTTFGVTYGSGKTSGI